jgi:hypothetical protein
VAWKYNIINKIKEENMKKKLCTAISIMVFFSGCVTSSVVQKSFPQIDKVQEYGYLFGSYKRNFMGVFSSNKMKIQITKIDGKKLENISLEYEMKESNKKGIFLFKLPEGRYSFYNMDLNGHKKDIKKVVEIKKGKIYYTGFSDYNNSIFLKRIKITKKNDLINDKKLLYKMYPNMKALKFEIFPIL